MLYTEEQMKAITDENHNLLVAAAAGSGKTQVMVERIIRLICEKKVPVAKLMVVTFTNAAASEMKERLEVSLEKRLESESNNREFLEEQISLVSQSTIGTMHSFCIEVIRANFDIVSVDPNFKVGAEVSIDLIKNKVLDRIFENEYEDKKNDFFELLDLFGGRGDEKLRDTILRMYREIQSQINPIEWLEDKVKFYKIREEEFGNSIIGETLLNHIKDIVRSAIEINTKALRYSISENGPKAYIEALEADKTLAENILNELEVSSNSFGDTLWNIFQKKSYQRLKSVKKQDLENKVVEPYIQNKTKSLRDDFKKRLDDINNIFPISSLSREIEKLNLMSQPLETLLNILKKFDYEYKKEKLIEGILDFNDLEHLTLKILKEPQIRDRYKKKYEYIFFDEYQDSNLVQETVIDSIKRENNLFFVGDVKQAIYRFRLSDPMLFNSRYKNYSNINNQNSMKIDLSKNFRTNAKVLKVINYIFKHLMSETLGEVDYSKEEAQLQAGVDFPLEDGGVEFDIINLSKSQKSDVNEFDLLENEVDYISEHVANRIEGLVGTNIYDNKVLVNRNIEYKDIAILLRSPKGVGSRIVKVLKERGIPVYFDYVETDSTSVEILALCDYLKIIDNRFQDEPLVGSLTSIFGNFSMEDMIDIKLAFPEEKYFYNAVDIYRSSYSNDLSKRLNIFFDKLFELKKMESYEELSDFIWHIIHDNAYLTYLKTMKFGDQKVRNVEALINKAKEFAQNGNKLFGFILYLDKIFKDKKDKIEPTPLDGENVVRIMSIHKSKGLEFPVVILADTKRKFNQQEYKEDIVLHNTLGIGSNFIDSELNIYNQTIAKMVIKEAKKSEALSEEVRILYVALTRAINRLIIVGGSDKIETSFKKAEKGRDYVSLKKINNYFDWIISIFWEHKAAWEIRRSFEEEVVEVDVDCEDLALTINVSDFSNETIKRENKNKIYTKLTLKKEIYECAKSIELDEILPIKKIDKMLKGKPLKQSVTEIVKSEMVILTKKPQKRRLSKTPKSLQEVIEITPMEKGTIIHNVLEHLDFKKIYSRDMIEIEINKMVALEKLTKEEKQLVDVLAVEAFLQGDLGKELLNSKIIYKEESFMLRENGILVDGIIDCYFFDSEDNIVLIDYKTDKIIDEKKYIPQLRLYKKALEAQYKRTVSKIYIYWFTNKTATRINI